MDRLHMLRFVMTCLHVGRHVLPEAVGIRLLEEKHYYLVKVEHGCR